MSRRDTWTRLGDDGCTLTGSILRAARQLASWAWTRKFS